MEKFVSGSRAFGVRLLAHAFVGGAVCFWFEVRLNIKLNA